MSARDDILGGIRRGLGRGAVPADDGRRAGGAGRRASPQPGAGTGRRARRRRRGSTLFVKMAEAVQTTVTRVAADRDVPGEVARYLAAENLPAELVMAPDPALDALPWSERPLLQIRRGKAEAGDAVSLTPCLAAVAETGTLMLVSGEATPTTLNFLPDTHIVVVRAGQVVASYEDGWDLLRAQSADRLWALAAHRQFHHRPVAHRRYRAAHRAGRAWSPPAACHHCRRCHIRMSFRGASSARTRNP